MDALCIGSSGSGDTGGATLNGARRWLRFAGVSIQPSEVAKFGMIFFMCSYMARHKDDMRTFTLGLAPMLLVIGIIAGLIMLQPNMSMAVIVAGIGAILLYVGGMDERYIIAVGVVAVVLFIMLAFLAVLVFYGYQYVMTGYKRLITTLNVSYAYVTSAVPVGALLMIISVGQNLYKSIKTPVEKWGEKA